jgi:tRNA A37 N6-isopentenylltransferase MiaA
MRSSKMSSTKRLRQSYKQEKRIIQSDSMNVYQVVEQGTKKTTVAYAILISRGSHQLAASGAK